MFKNLLFIPLWKYFMRALSMIQPMGCIHVSDIQVSDPLNDAFRCWLSDRIQIVTSVSIVSCFMPFLEYRDNDSGLQPSSYPYILGRELNLYKIKPAVSICIINQSRASEVLRTWDTSHYCSTRYMKPTYITKPGIKGLKVWLGNVL